MGNPTERVRKLLKERGVTYDEKSVDGCGTLFSINLLEQCDDYTSSIFVYNTYIEVMRKYLTPEQAIAATLCEYTYEQWRAINEIVGNAMEYAHDVAIMHPDKADPCWDLSNYVDQILEVAYGDKESEQKVSAEWRSVALGLFNALEKADLETAKRWLCDNDLLGQEIAYGDAIAATVGEEYEMHICKRCGVAYELNIIDEEFGKSRFCPNCGYREMYQ